MNEKGPVDRDRDQQDAERESIKSQRQAWQKANPGKVLPRRNISDVGWDSGTEGHTGLGQRDAGRMENDLRTYFLRLAEGERARDAFAAEGIDNDFDEEVWEPPTHLTEQFKQFLSPYAQKSYRHDLLRNLGVDQRSPEDALPLTEKIMGVDDLEVLLLDPASEEMDALLEDPEYQGREWYFTNASHLLPKAVLIGKTGKDYPDTVITDNTIQINPPMSSEDRIHSWRKVRGARAPKTVLGAPGEMVFKTKLDVTQPDFHPKVTNRSGQPLRSAAMSDLLLSPDTNTSVFSIGKDHHLAIGPGSPSKIEIGDPLSPGFDAPIIYYPEGKSKEGYHLPLTKRSAQALWVKDWDKHAREAFEHLYENDYWLDDEAAASLSSIAIDLGGGIALQLAEVLTSFGAIESGPIIKAMSNRPNVIGEVEFVDIDMEYPRLLLQHLVDSREYNTYE